MFRIIATLGALYTAYKIGESKTRLEQLDFFVTSTTSQNNIYITTYATISEQSGTIEFSQDINNATILNYWDAMSLRGLIKKYTPGAAIELETVSTLLTN